MSNYNGIVQCPNLNCHSDNVYNVSHDSNEFICEDCGEDFYADYDDEE
jgi:aspartate carbamoyltransferase regulatory subunit